MIQSFNVSVQTVATTANATFTGPFASDQGLTVLMSKIGNLVTVEIPAVSAAGALAPTATASAIVSDPYRPQGLVTIPCTVKSGGVNLGSPGKLSVGTDGTVTISANLLSALNFSLTGQNGWDRCAINYVSATST